MKVPLPPRLPRECWVRSSHVDRQERLPGEAEWWEQLEVSKEKACQRVEPVMRNRAAGYFPRSQVPFRRGAVQSEAG